jgi:hypothetical protein
MKQSIYEQIISVHCTNMTNQLTHLIYQRKNSSFRFKKKDKKNNSKIFKCRNKVDQDEARQKKIKKKNLSKKSR